MAKDTSDSASIPDKRGAGRVGEELAKGWGRAGCRAGLGIEGVMYAVGVMVMHAITICRAGLGIARRVNTEAAASYRVCERALLRIRVRVGRRLRVRQY